MQTLNRLQKLGLCLGHTGTIQLLEKLGSNFDAKVVEWRENLLCEELEVLRSIV